MSISEPLLFIIKLTSQNFIDIPRGNQPVTGVSCHSISKISKTVKSKFLPNNFESYRTKSLHKNDIFRWNKIFLISEHLNFKN